MAPKRANKEYYAVVEGRVDEPTIFSSWGDAHPRVTGCRAVYQGFHTIEKARQFMEKKGVTNHKEVIKDGAGETTPVWKSKAYYAVAHGQPPGIYEYCGVTEPKVTKVPNACHKHFRTLDQAKAFIEDWKESFVAVYERELKKALDNGFRPNDLELSVTDSLHETGLMTQNAGDLSDLKLDKLNIKDVEA